MDTAMAEPLSPTPGEDLSRLRLFRLLSPMLPIGSFSWSQGLETANERGFLDNRSRAYEWISAQLLHTIAPTEGAFLIRLFQSLARQDQEAFVAWNQTLLATRETRELWEEDQEQGELLTRLNLLHYPRHKRILSSYSLIAAFAEALHLADIPLQHGLEGFFWMWSEGQVIQAIKLIPLGLKDGQWLLDQVLCDVPSALTRAYQCPDEELGLSLLGRSLVSAWHETQYSRIYRS
jgi:urease accessory protein